MYKETNDSALPPHVGLMLDILKKEEENLKKTQRKIGRKIKLNDKTLGCNCGFENLQQEVNGVEISEKHISFSEPIIAHPKENIRYRRAKKDGLEDASINQR